MPEEVARRAVAALVPAAGSGQRLGAGGPKALQLLEGLPLVVHAVRALRAGGVEQIVVAAPPGAVDRVQSLLAAVAPLVAVVPGGGSRQESVQRALAALPAGADIVLVHDAARPLVPPDVVHRVVAAVRAGADAVVPVVEVVDTVRRVDGTGTALEILDRSRLRAVQTPQGFARAVLDEAHAAAPAGTDVTDDAGLVERCGVAVVTVPGATEAFKVTRPLDLLLAQAVLAQRATAESGP